MGHYDEQREKHDEKMSAHLRQLKTAGIGDVTSKERGTAARYNADKAKLQYVPMRLLLVATEHNFDEAIDPYLAACGETMAEFEEGRDTAIFDLIHMMDLKGTCEVFHFGAKKYAAWNWAKGFDWSTVIACFKRHWLAAATGEKTDPESGLPHMDHAGCNVVMLAHFTAYWRQGDDRPDPALFTKDPA